MHLLITGGAGFIGSNLAEVAVRAGHDVIVIDDLSTGTLDNLTGIDVDFRQGSILDDDLTRDALADTESVIHLGALGSIPRSIEAPLATHSANATGTLELLEQSRATGVQHFITASSSSVYGMNPAMPKDERQWVRPMSPYAASKLAAEQYTLAYQQSYGMETLALRFFNVYGPRQRPGTVYAAVIPTFIDAILSGHAVPVHGNGSQTRDFTFVGTVCEVLLEAAERRVCHPHPVNLAFGTRISLSDLLAELRLITGIDFAIENLPSRPGDVQHSQAQSRVLQTLFPDIQATPLNEGLKETVAWLRGAQ